MEFAVAEESDATDYDVIARDADRPSGTTHLCPGFDGHNFIETFMCGDTVSDQESGAGSGNEILQDLPALQPPNLLVIVTGDATRQALSGHGKTFHQKRFEFSSTETVTPKRWPM